MSERVTLPVHLSSLGLERNPFPQTPDADSYFRTEGIEQQYSETLHCVLSGKGFTLLTGEVGTGKSTFLRTLMEDLLGADCSISFVFNTFLQGRDLLLAVNRDFGLSAGTDFAEDIDRLNHFLISQHAIGKTCVVLIDDAQNLDTASLELLRLLSNLETRQNKLLQIVLSGQPEILDVLAKPEIRQFASRIVHHTQLIAFTHAECVRYVDFRILSSGSDGRIRLDKGAQSALYRHSKGNPRRVHLIMDRCMYGVLATGHRKIGKHLLDLAASEVGVAAYARSPRSAKNLSLAVLAFLGIGVAAWAAIPSTAISPANTQVATIPMSVPAALPFKQTLGVCLKNLGAGKWQTVLQNDLSIETQPKFSRSLAADGLALVSLPVGLNLAEQANVNYCQWKTTSGAWLLWHPAYPPFDPANGKRGSNVRWLQQKLTEAGFYTVPVDGIVGVHTLDGLNAFRRQHGLTSSGNADGWTVFLLEQNLGNIRQGKNNG